MIRVAFTMAIFVAFLAYSVAYLAVAFTSDMTLWWWWFVPAYGTYKIFATSVGLDIFHIGILPLVWIGGLVVGLLEG